uniref:CCHC-type domain-containing protein n=1 Tax=Caenorhabditis tropicalis TaxID=1561998 RepID=A0A1I7U6Q0_9PELO
MANANLTLMPFVRKFGSANTTIDRDGNSASKDGGKVHKPSLASLAQSAFPSRYDPDAFIDVSGAAISAPTVTGACKRCGYPGHLYFQCRNHIEVRPNMSTKAYEVSSTSSESSEEETPLVALEKERKKEKKLRKKERKEREKAKKLEKKERKRKERKEKKKRRDDSDEESDSENDKKKKKKERKEKKKRSYDDSDDSDSEEERSRKKSKKSKKESRKRRCSSSSVDTFISDSDNDHRRSKYHRRS